MRFFAAMLTWLIATAALAVAVPSGYVQRHVVDVDGYAALARDAAGEPRLQEAAAAELTDQIVERFDLNSGLIGGVARGYTESDQFPQQFADLNRIVHRWMFTDEVEQVSENTWQVDIEPMVAQSSLGPVLDRFGVDVPKPLNVPVTLETGARSGQLEWLGAWGGPISVGSAIIAAVFALLTLLIARARGKALVALGVSALLVGAGGYAGLELSRGYVDGKLDNLNANVRQIADVMVARAEDGLHGWLNLTLTAGAVLVVVGVIAAIVGGLIFKKRTQPEPVAHPTYY